MCTENAFIFCSCLGGFSKQYEGDWRYAGTVIPMEVAQETLTCNAVESLATALGRQKWMGSRHLLLLSCLTKPGVWQLLVLMNVRRLV